jgi:hypothetical protein
VLDAAENWKSDEAASPWRTLLQFGVGIRDPVDGLRWASPIVVADVLGDDAPDMVRTQGEEIIGPDLVGVVADEPAPGLPTLASRDFRRQSSLKPRRCHPMTVSGLTMIRGRDHPDQALRRRAQKSRSWDRSRGRR